MKRKQSELMSKRLLTIQKLIALGIIGGGGAVLAPELLVYGGASTDVLIASGDVTPRTLDGTDFGLMALTATPQPSSIFRLTNSGGGTLSITAVDIPYADDTYFLTDTNDDPLSFPISILGSASYDIKILFSPTTSAVFAGTVTISGDAIEDYTFAITGSSAYDARVLVQSPLRFYKMIEGSGTTAVDSSTNAQNGTHSGITWDATGGILSDPAPIYDGALDYTNIYNANLGTNFNMDEFTILIWAKVNAAGVWTDGASRNLITLRRDVNNRILIFKGTTNNQLRLFRAGNGTAKEVSVTGQNETGYVCYAFSVSLAGGGLLGAGEMKAYKNGAQLGTTQTGNVASAGSGLSSTEAVIGASTTTASNPYHGWLQRVQIYNGAITQARLDLSGL